MARKNIKAKVPESTYWYFTIIVTKLYLEGTWVWKNQLVSNMNNNKCKHSHFTLLICSRIPRMICFLGWRVYPQTFNVPFELISQSAPSYYHIIFLPTFFRRKRRDRESYIVERKRSAVGVDPSVILSIVGSPTRTVPRTT